MDLHVSLLRILQTFFVYLPALCFLPSRRREKVEIMEINNNRGEN